MIIALTGVPGSGKTTIAHLLSDRLKLPYHNLGFFRRQCASKQGMDLQTYNTAFYNDFSEDKKIDHYQKNLGETKDDFIIDGRLSWYFIPKSFKIFLDVSLEEAAKRVLKATTHGERKNEPLYQSLEEAKQAVENRLKADQKRYLDFYKIDYLDHAHYDLVIDTSDKTPEEIVELILQALPNT
ncbi:MAG: Cytidylate kinase [Candidatus Uhrbacteria bacterium GW2011_GWE2_40_58]|nr:MAG: Cytidylate kinase [Candidatus Uhrbacteria bacterium GW2011_GWF2_40_263]KKR67641.1 MAG: Cytidylate kinase [Candidatus Uhrbacteria bacterium GW2011_GWE2_40_58]OGL94431.1 MAG: hypothetical protein A2239_01965 [Candidatus Uhrbacteria bacterium RIFOXYA2_FULL_40_9]OGL96677.1 MAG: hypothetical protein A2332_05135 [Candidatus Uhrbacteria bacterium RIFOXYB2_FULL_41_18]HBK34708.1 hypothetical protein [Candidatus Uhrbacteria bacterium]